MYEFIPVPFAPDYEINRDGVIRSVTRMSRESSNRQPRKVLGKVINQHINMGYPTVRIEVDGRQRNYRVHRLLMMVFGPPQPPGKSYVCHNNDDRQDITVANLKWGDQKDNMADARQNGRLTTGERNRHAILTAATVAELRCLHKDGWTYRELGTRFGVKPHTAYSIVRGLTWKHIP
jgi:hypothetical protein